MGAQSCWDSGVGVACAWALRAWELGWFFPSFHQSLLKRCLQAGSALSAWGGEEGEDRKRSVSVFICKRIYTSPSLATRKWS